MVCAKCNDVKDMEAELFVGGETPSCGECEKKKGERVASGCRSHGIGRLRPRMVLYNEYNPDQEAINPVIEEDLRSQPDAVVVIGTSLKVPGVGRLFQDMAKEVRRQNGVTVWINNADRPPKGLGNWDLEMVLDLQYPFGITNGLSAKVHQVNLHLVQASFADDWCDDGLCLIPPVEGADDTCVEDPLDISLRDSVVPLSHFDPRLDDA